MRRAGFLLFRWLLVLILLGPALAQVPVESPATEEPTAAAPEAAPAREAPAVAVAEVPTIPGPWAQLEPLVDGIMAAQFQNHPLAGGAVGICIDGQVALLKGYGYADLERRIPVDPETTLFRLASVTKLFTWKLVMELAESGEIDLDRDVNGYLQTVRIPEAFEQPVTLRHLMSHTAGFEDRVIRLFRRDPDELLPLPLALIRAMPERIRPPGDAESYSNFGSALAALVLQEVTGIPWEDLVERRILRPLAMERTSVRQPVEDRLAPGLAKGYSFERGELVPMPFEVVSATPAGGASASVADVLRFAASQLGSPAGSVPADSATPQGEVRIPMTFPAPGVPGMARGYMVGDWYGLQVLQHGGTLSRAHCGLYLVPERRFALFIAFNAQAGGRARDAVVAAMARLLFASDKPVPEDAGSLSDTGPLEGWYRPLRRSESGIDRLLELGAQVRVESAGPGRVRTLPVRDSAEVWEEDRPSSFVGVRSERRITFTTASDGRLRMIPGGRSPLGWERARWYETLPFHQRLAAACLLIMLTPLVFPLGDWLLDARSDRMLSRRPPSQTPARILAAATSACLVSFAVWLSVQFLTPENLLYELPPLLEWMLVLPLLGGVLAVTQTIVTVMAWRAGYWGWAGRLHYSLVTAAAVAFTWQLGYWNLLGWNY